MLMHRQAGPDQDYCAGVLYLDMPTRPRFKRFRRQELVRCRPTARTTPFYGSFHSGPLQCVCKADSVREFFSEARPYPRGRPPCAPAAHWLAAMGYAELPW